MAIRNRASESVPPIVVESPRNRVVQSNAAQNFVDLDDKATADLPAINGPLAAAIAAAGTAITEPSVGVGQVTIGGNVRFFTTFDTNPNP